MILPEFMDWRIKYSLDVHATQSHLQIHSAITIKIPRYLSQN